MLRKIKKLIFHPYWYFFDYSRKKLGFKKYFVTDVMKPYREMEDRTWYKLLISYPYQYLYDFTRIKLNKAAYPILVDYRIETLSENHMGGGRNVVLAIELEEQNTIYFADAEIVLKVLSHKEPYIARAFLKFKFEGRGNKIFIGANTNIAPGVMIKFIGSYNSLVIGKNTIIGENTKIKFNGANNAFYIGIGCTLNPNTKINFTKNCNCIYLGDNSKISQIASFQFNGNNALIYFAGRSPVTACIQIWSNSIFFTGFGSSFGGDGRNVTTIRLQEQKNIIIGSSTMVTRGCYIRNSDGHILYDAKTQKRINPSKSIIIGDKVWIGQFSLISKGSRIETGAMVGANSVVSNKTIPAHCMAVGSPARVIKQDIIIDGRGTGNFLDGDTARYETYHPPQNIPKWDFGKLIKIDSIDHNISSKIKIQLIKNILLD